MSHYALAAWKPSLLTAAIKALSVVFLGSNWTRADPTATASTVVPGTDLSAVVTFPMYAVSVPGRAF